MGQGMAALKIVANSIGPTASVAAVIVLPPPELPLFCPASP